MSDNKPLSKELRIGNWIMAPLGEFMKVETIGHKDKLDYIFARGKDGYGQNAFEPIPLTPEILEKSGFKNITQDGHRWFWHMKDGFGIDTKDEKNYLYNNEDLEVHPKELKYLHQLQNLYFALTSSELEIKL